MFIQNFKDIMLWRWFNSVPASPLLVKNSTLVHFNYFVEGLIQD